MDEINVINENLLSLMREAIILHTRGANELFAILQPYRRKEAASPKETISIYFSLVILFIYFLSQPLHLSLLFSKS